MPEATFSGVRRSNIRVRLAELPEKVNRSSDRDFKPSYPRSSARNQTRERATSFYPATVCGRSNTGDGAGCGAVRVGGLRRRRGSQLVERNFFHRSRRRDDRHQLHRLQRDQLIWRIGGAIYGDPGKRRRGDRHVEGERRRRKQRSGDDYRKRPIYAAQLSHGGQCAGDGDGIHECRHNGDHGADRHAGLSAAADAGECGSGRERNSIDHRLPG